MHYRELYFPDERPARALQALRSVLAFVINNDGVVTHSNAGFLTLCHADSGTCAQSHFVSPTFDELMRLTPTADGSPAYTGLITLRNARKDYVSLSAFIFRSDTGLACVAERVIEHDELVIASLIDLTVEGTATSRAFAKARREAERTIREQDALLIRGARRERLARLRARRIDLRRQRLERKFRAAVGAEASTRMSVAHDLHEGVCQSLAALKIQLQLTDLNASRAQLKRSIALTQAILQRVRELAQTLQPTPAAS